MAALCWESSVPFLHVRSYGLLGHVRLVRRGEGAGAHARPRRL